MIIEKHDRNFAKSWQGFSSTKPLTVGGLWIIAIHQQIEIDDIRNIDKNTKILLVVSLRNEICLLQIKFDILYIIYSLFWWLTSSYIIKFATYPTYPTN